ncbi:DUF2442 domain-containing protein [Dyella flagellata]|uniref:DUF2442 domain-containing protein n=1 Tax=Dyella flagellata TaxID=1867833 RepID=A0ABQ5X5M4_9GAMM|nr:DUF2442 domain-containing protein [Dyella flagellata]GLQ86499.1 hypothetical protein GCM10007898_00650 [Dyella flagellata]
MSKIRAATRFDRLVTEEVLDRAIVRGTRRKNAGVHATSVSYVPKLHALLVGFADHSAVVLPVNNYPELEALSTAELKGMEVGFGGSALCLGKRDLHISIAGLVAASKSLMAMANTVVATHHGSRSSKAKAASSRENGRKGGRPRKHAA